METAFNLLSSEMILASLAIALMAGVIKGVVGFAMPMILISGLSSFISPELALAGLLMPTLASNGVQALRQGRAAAWRSVFEFRIFLLAGLVTLLISAQFVRLLPAQAALLLIGGPVAIFATVQLFGIGFHLDRPSAKIELMVGGFAGFIGGLSGVWGPPTVAYLTALDTEKSAQVRIQGVIYGLGALALVVAHIWSGVLRSATLPFSLMLVPSALVGMWLGGKLHDRIDQSVFRKVTLLVLLVAALNLIRRAVIG